jgi:ribokinase
MKRIVVFGSISYDRTLHLPRLPEAGQGLMASAVTHSVGGKGANVAVAAVRAGGRASLVSAVGADGDRALAELSDAGVDTAWIERRADLATAEVIIHLATDQREFGITVPGADRHVDRRAMQTAIDTFRGGSIGYLDGMMNDGAFVIEAMAARGAPLVINPSPLHPDVERWPMHKAAVVIVNQDEACRLTQRDDPHHQLDALCSRLPGPAFVLTRGAEGAWLCRGDHREHVAATPVAAIDSTAAGDTFAGYFLAGVAAGRPPVESMRMAARAAAICVTRHGSLHSIPGRREVERAIAD